VQGTPVNKQLKEENQEQVEAPLCEPHRKCASSPLAASCADSTAAGLSTDDRSCDTDSSPTLSQDILVRVNSLGNEEVFNGSVAKHATLYDFKTMLTSPAKCLEKQMQMSLGPLILKDDSKPLVDLMADGSSELQLTLVRQRAFDLKVHVDLTYGYTEQFTMEDATKHTTLGEAAKKFCRDFAEVTSMRGVEGFFSACLQMTDRMSESRTRKSDNPDWANMTLEKMGWDDSTEGLCIQWDI